MNAAKEVQNLFSLIDKQCEKSSKLNTLFYECTNNTFVSQQSATIKSLTKKRATIANIENRR